MMKLLTLTKYILLFLVTSSLYSCVTGRNVATKINIYPQVWYPAITYLPLQKPLGKIKSKADLKELLDRKWNKNSILNLADYKIDNSFEYKIKKMVARLESCNDYIYKNIKNAGPISRKFSFYMQLGFMCEAINIALHGENSTVSYIGKFTLNRALADKLPIELAFAVSPDSHEVIKKNKGKSWTFLDTIKGLKKMSPYVTQYKIEDATQTISLLARGDFNHDHQEDVLVLVENSIDDGHYNPTRLFTLTRDKGATLFRVIKQYQLRSNVDK